MEDTTSNTAVVTQPGSGSSIEEDQTRAYSEAIGNLLPKGAIIDLYGYLHDARPHKSYESLAEVRFIYEIIHIDESREQVKKVVDLWVADGSNVKRAAAQVGRQPEKSGKNPLRGYCVFKLKQFDGDGWLTVLDSLGTDQHEPQTVVFIALEDLDSSNGFFMALRQGNDVCLDSRAELRFPSTGGGMGIFIALNL